MLADFPKNILLSVTKFVSIEDTLRLYVTCRRLRRILRPRILHIQGKDFVSTESEESLYFDAPELKSAVNSLKMSLVWRDQGWGNRKARVWLQLIRTGEGKVTEAKRIFDYADHEGEEVEKVLVDDPVVKMARKGDFFR